MTRRVVFLGAGASAPAGYPLGASLLQTIGDWINEGPVMEPLRTYWRQFVEFREQASGVSRTLLGSPDPEVVLTTLDLYIQGLRAYDQAVESETADALRRFHGLATPEEQTAYAA